MRQVHLLRMSCQGIALVLSLASMLSYAQTATDPEAIERAKRLAESPYRWIILADQIKSKRTGNSAETPANKGPASPTAPAARVPSAPSARASTRSAPPPQSSVNTTSPAIQVAPQVSTGSAPVVANLNTATNTLTSTTVPETKANVDSSVNSSEKVVFELFDTSEAKVLADGSIADSQGGFFLPTVFTYSETKPNPVKANFSYEDSNRLIRFSYDVPASVGYFGGAGVVAYAAADGKDLSGLIKNDRATGVVVLRLGAMVETRLKISIIGPKERNDSSYPFFILPLKPGLHTYGLELADFKQPPWVKDAPTIEEALRNVVGVSVEYARGNANGLVDKSEIRVGDIRFSSLNQ
jgi:hypothetical protein